MTNADGESPSLLQLPLPLSRRLNHYGAAVSLHAAFKSVSDNLDLLKQQSLNAGKMAEALFDRKRTYPELAEFIIETD
jgi:hypothetical protein